MLDSNLLILALRMIPPVPVQYYQFLSRTENAIGNFVPGYAEPVMLMGSFQPVPKNLYAQYGLDFTRNYFTFYTIQNVVDVTTDISGDQLVHNGRRYQCEANNDWYQYNGWMGVLCVQVDA